jgi:glycogen debranching enzyme
MLLPESLGRGGGRAVDSPRLLHTLKVIENENKLWTPYGLRSLAKDDKFYGTSENYWRGPIWININYLVLASLKQNYLKVSERRARVQNNQEPTY